VTSLQDGLGRALSVFKVIDHGAATASRRFEVNQSAAQLAYYQYPIVRECRGRDADGCLTKLRVRPRTPPRTGGRTLCPLFLLSERTSLITGNRGTATVGILTITDEEFENARRILGLAANIVGSGYYVESLNPENQYDRVLVKSIDRANLPAYETTGDLIGDWRPPYIFLMGTAGAMWDRKRKRGVDVNLGDVVIGDFVEYIEFTKLERGEYIRRTIPLDHPSLCLRGDFAEALRRETAWHSWIGVDRPAKPESNRGVPVVKVGNVASGEKILSDPRSEFQQYVMDNYDKAMAFEMESAGVARAILRSRKVPEYNPQFLTIRGVSDFINEKVAGKTRKSWTPYASSAAIAFGKAVIENVLKVAKL
jgi:nucleoside phosphorylase